MKAIFTAFVVVLSASYATSEVISLETELSFYKTRINALLALLQKTCPGGLNDHLDRTFQRDTRTALPPSLQLSLEKIHASQLSELLVKCHGENRPVRSTTMKQYSSAATTDRSASNTSKAGNDSFDTTTTGYNGTSASFQEAEKICNGALPLRDRLRSKNNTGERDSDALCDFRLLQSKGYPWFKLVDDAGTRLATKCPPDHSCGSDAGIYSDNQPSYESVGVSYNFTAYASFYDNCRKKSIDMETMKCNDDLIIYRMKPRVSWCDAAFCGINVL